MKARGDAEGWASRWYGRVWFGFVSPGLFLGWHSAVPPASALPSWCRSPRLPPSLRVAILFFLNVYV